MVKYDIGHDLQIQAGSLVSGIEENDPRFPIVNVLYLLVDMGLLALYFGIFDVVGVEVVLDWLESFVVQRDDNVLSHVSCQVVAANVWRLLAVGLSKHQLSITSNVYLKINVY